MLEIDRHQTRLTMISQIYSEDWINFRSMCLTIFSYSSCSLETLTLLLLVKFVSDNSGKFLIIFGES